MINVSNPRLDPMNLPEFPVKPSLRENAPVLARGPESNVYYRPETKQTFQTKLSLDKYDQTKPSLDNYDQTKPSLDSYDQTKSFFNKYDQTKPPLDKYDQTKLSFNK